MAKVKSYRTIYNDSPPHGYTKIEIQIAELENSRVRKNKGMHIIKYMSKKERGYGFTIYPPSYKGLRAMIDGMVEIYGKSEVEKELGIKIK